MNIRYPIYEGVYRILTFFHGKPCRRPPKNKQEEAQEIRMPTRVGHV